MSRECGSCTRCCEGWLVTEVNLRTMYPGKGCPYVKSGKGCGIYEIRPVDPCRAYKCHWLLEDEVPKKFQPHKSGTIANFVSAYGIPTVTLVPAPNPASGELLDWYKDYVMRKGFGLIWKDSDDIPYFYGAPEIIDVFKQNVIY